MSFRTDEIIKLLIDNVSTMEEVQSIGISGGKAKFPKAGEGDIDIFIYCDTIPEVNKRQAIVNQLGDLLMEIKLNVFEEGHWGIGDFALVNGIETWLMYFTTDENSKDVESILNGDHPYKLDNYYYPVGRLAMLKDINVLYDKTGYLYLLKERLSEYPDELAEKLIQYNMEELDDIEDLDRAAARGDVLFYHFAIDIAIDHYLQALFAINKTYFPSRKRTLDFIKDFKIKPEGCEEQIMEVVKLGAYSEGIGQSYELWLNMINELKKIRRR